MEKNSILSDFIVLNRQRINELEADLWQMEHQKSGARLVWLERAEENKTFAIAFQTQPWDDTGVFHILEHSVLCGSERYPVKEPFVELMKSSLNTFLNAMTFPEIPALEIKVISDPEEGDYSQGILNLIDLDNVDMSKFPVGQVDGMCGKAAYEYIAKSIELANAKKVAAVSTTPVNKESFKAGGVNFIGHTEIFGALTGTADPASARDELLHTMACKAAIKGGWRSGAEELEEVARTVMSGAVKYCPHGRPVAIEMTKKQLEKQFKRT